LMRCYVAAGQRSLALEQVRRCRETLRRELQVEPMPETWQLYRQIRGDQSLTPPPPKGQGDRSSLQAALAQFRRALDGVESAWQALQAAATELVEGRESSPGGTAYPLPACPGASRSLLTPSLRGLGSPGPSLLPRCDAAVIRL
jgi:hypothetical protein